MAAIRRTVFNDGVAPTVADMNQLALGTDLLIQQLLDLMLGERESEGTRGFTAEVAPGATDVGGAAVATFGFLGPSLRVTRIDATHIRVNPGIGLQYGTSGVPTGEAALRVVSMGVTAPELDPGITLSSLPGAGLFKRTIVATKWRDVSVSDTRQYIDNAGNPVPLTVPVRVGPEVGLVDALSSGIVLVPGTSAGTAAGATRPATPSGYVALAELLLDETGLLTAANPDGVTVGITDLRTRVRPSKAGGAYDSRRATCSMDEATALRSVRRMGAKRVGVEEVDGWVQVATGAAASVTLDTSRDWRDAMVRIEYCALAQLDNVPGGVSDSAFTRNDINCQSATEISGVSGIGTAVWYSALGSADGTSGPFAGPCRTPADHASTVLVFYADSTTGALKCRGLAGGVNRELYFCATLRGPLGKRPAAGVES